MCFPFATDQCEPLAEDSALLRMEVGGVEAMGVDVEVSDECKDVIWAECLGELEPRAV